MKKTIIYSVVAIALITVSCKKERSCECNVTQTVVDTYASTNVSNTSSYTSKVTAEKQTKKYFRMDQQCYSGKTTDTQVHSNYTEVVTSDATCTLK